MVGLDLNTIKHALNVARKEGYGEVQLRSGGVSFSAKLSTSSKSTSKKRAETKLLETPDSEICSSAVGFFRNLKKPVKVGQSIEIGEPVGQVIALGIANDIESLYEGEITEIAVEDGDPVEYGQVIAKVKVSR